MRKPNDDPVGENKKDTPCTVVGKQLKSNIKYFKRL